MPDGKVSILVDVDGKQVKVLNEELDRVAQKGNQGSSALKNFAIGAGAFKVATVAIDVMKQSLDKAISRFDTLEKFPRVMQAMGHSAEDVTRATDKLSNGIEGLPTTLDEVVSTAQQLTSITGDLNKSTNLTLALNNAFLASGASSADASRGLQQYTQMLSAGKVDLQSWKTLQETMPYALQKTAESFGFAGASAQRDFYSTLQSGQVTFDQFSKKLIELDGGVGGFAEMAKENSKGIATSFGNLKNAVAKGSASVLKAFDDLSKATTGKTIAENIDTLKIVINAGFKLMAVTVKTSTPVFKFFFNTIKSGISVMEPFTPVILGVIAAIGAYQVITKATITIQAWYRSWLVAEAALKIATTLMKSMIAVQAVSTTMTKADMVARMQQLGILKVASVVYGVLTGAISLSTAATIAHTVAVNALAAAINFLTGPIGLVIAVIGVLVAAGIGLWTWLNRETEETKRLKSEQEKLSKQTDELTDSIKQNTRERKQAVENTDKEALSYKKLADEIVNLASKTTKTAAEKKNLQKKIETLNGAVDSLNLAYDKNTGSLSHNTEQLYARIDAMEAESKWQTTQENLLSIEKERTDINKQLADISKQRKDISEAQDISDRQRWQMLGELKTKENELQIALQNNQAEYAKTAEAQNAAAEVMAAATENGTNRQVIAYENMSQAQQSAVDSMRQRFQELSDTTTSMFDQIEQKTALSVEQINANLEANRAATEQWASNLEVLAQRGVDQGILEQLRQMGPEGAAQTQVFVDATQEELNHLQENFRASGEAAKTAINQELSSAGQEVPQGVRDMVTGITTGLHAELANADFASLGQQVPNGTAEGINAGSPKAAEAARKMSEITKKSFQQDMGIHSPSRVFTEYGGHITSGLANGIANGSAGVLARTIALSTNVKHPFASLRPDFTNIGQMAMDGMAAGIMSGSGSVMAAAQNIASRVKATIQNALDIHSPSRVMRDEVGRFIPQGIAVGIDADAGVIKKSMERLKTSMLIDVNPEVSFGLNKKLGANVTVKQTARQAMSEKIEIVMGKSNGLIDKALDTIDKLASRPNEMRFDDDTLVAKTVDKFQERIRWNEENNNRAWGIVDG